MLLHKHLNTGIRDTGLVDREGGPWGSPDFRCRAGFYKRECQEKVFPQRRRGESVLDIQPLSPGFMALAAPLGNR